MSGTLIARELHKAHGAATILAGVSVTVAPGDVLGLAAVIRDLSKDKLAEAERDALEAQVIESQDALIRELSTPLLPIAKGVIVLPLIGSINDARAQQILEALLYGIQEHQAHAAILDITGVPTVDTLTAQHLLKTVTAARLMGAECIISGIRPQIAQTIVHLGIELAGITTKASLADAFAVALERTGRCVQKIAGHRPS